MPDRATMQHLQVLQADGPLEAPTPACLGAPSLPEPSARELFAGIEEADEDRLRSLLRTAEFWLLLLEGERGELREEVARQKKRYQQLLRQAESKASELRESEGERKRLQKELLRARHELENYRRRSRPRAEEKDDDEREQKLAQMLRERDGFEETLVRTKVQHAEVLQKVDSMEVLLQYYVDQLRVFNPHFEPADVAMWPGRPRHLDSEQDSNTDQRSETTEASYGRKAMRFRGSLSKVKRILSGTGKMQRGLPRQQSTDLDQHRGRASAGETPAESSTMPEAQDPPASSDPEVSSPCSSRRDAPRSRARWEMRTDG